mmetsp:Transcript_3072/g.11110  ORF Transcript_3072/g.11110 Transcript_3072/m.11110 type:complete len:208 (+) Transcript_3072:1155-1778(+)
MTSARAATASFSVKSLATRSCTMKRCAHTHVCPELRNLLDIAPRTAESISASSHTINGAFPPSSILMRLTVSALCLINNFPTCVLPVNVILRTVGDAHNFSPIALASPATNCNTPSGHPASRARTPNANALKGVSSLGFITIEHPAASAAPALRVIIASGKFHGVIAAVVPTGCFIAVILDPTELAGTTSPYTRRASSAYHSKNDAA